MSSLSPSTAAMQLLKDTNSSTEQESSSDNSGTHVVSPCHSDSPDASPKATAITTGVDSQQSLTTGTAPRKRDIPNRIQVAVRLRPLTASDVKKDPVPLERLGVRRITAAGGGKHNKEGPTMVDPAEIPRAWHVESSKNDTTGHEEQVLVQKGVHRRVPGRNLFCFDTILEEPTRTVNAYWKIARPVVEAVASGRHGTIFCYGPTGSGKTYTMQGDPSQIGKSIGMIHMAAADLLASTDNEDRERTVRIQYFEVYNEQIRDLLALVKEKSGTVVDRAPSAKSLAASNQPSPPTRSTESGVSLGQDPVSGNVTVHARQQVVTCVQDIAYWLRRARPFRSSGSTSLNAHSSRSHAIFRVSVSSRPKDGSMRVRESTLNLVDLAGSENSSSANASGLRKRETGKINQSLLALSRVIHALSLPEKKRPKHIGYRDSKLTRILQPHLSGNACMAILCCVAAGKKQLEVTRSALRFADSAKRIRLQPRINESVDLNAIIQSLRRELEESKAHVARLQADLHKGTLSEMSSMAESSASSESEAESEEGMVVGITGTFSPKEDGVARLEIGKDQQQDTLWKNGISRSRTESTSGGEGPMDEVVLLPQKRVSNLQLSSGMSTPARSLFLDDEEDSEFNEEESRLQTQSREQSFVESLEASFAKSSPMRMSTVVRQKYTLLTDVDFLGQQRVMLQVGMGVALLGHFTHSTELFLAAMLFLWLSVSATAEPAAAKARL